MFGESMDRGNVWRRRAKSLAVGGDEMRESTSAGRSRKGRYIEGGRGVKAAGCIPPCADGVGAGDELLEGAGEDKEP